MSTQKHTTFTSNVQNNTEYKKLYAMAFGWIDIHKEYEKLI